MEGEQQRMAFPDASRPSNVVRPRLAVYLDGLLPRFGRPAQKRRCPDPDNKQDENEERDADEQQVYHQIRFAIMVWAGGRAGLLAIRSEAPASRPPHAQP